MKHLKFTLPVILIFIILLITNTLTRFDLGLQDFIFQKEGTPDPRIIIVGIDEKSLDEVGQWPWPRYLMADMLDKLNELGAAAIGVDVLYDSYSQDDDADARLVEAAKANERTVFAKYATFSGLADAAWNAETFAMPFPELDAVTKKGYINVNPDPIDGRVRHLIRQINYKGETHHSFPVEILKMYRQNTNQKVIDVNDIPADKYGRYFLDYTSAPGGYTKLSFTGVLWDEYDTGLFKDAIVLIGPYAMGISQDHYPTPMDYQSRMYGIEIHANAIQALIESNFKTEVPMPVEVLFLLLWGIAASCLFNRLKPYQSVILLFAGVLVLLLIPMLLYNRFDLIFTAIYSVILHISLYVTSLVLQLITSHKEKKYIINVFGRFVAPQIVKEIIDGNVALELGGVLREVSVLFVDIRGFTAFSEANTPETVVKIVNRYLDLTSRSIQQFDGTIDKYLGDATMAMFNAPQDLPNHALSAVKAAWAMKQGSAALREEIMKDFGIDLQFGIGVNTGQAVVGNMGSNFRMDYTVIGDTVNTASRLEANAAKGKIIISEATFERVKDHIIATDMGLLNVKNKKEGIHIYSVEGMND